MFQTGSQHVEWSQILQYEDETWYSHVRWHIVDLLTRDVRTQALGSRHQSAGSQQLERCLAALRHIWPAAGGTTSEKRWRLTWWRWPAELRSRHTTVPRNSRSLKDQISLTSTHSTMSHGPASAHLSTPGVRISCY